MAECANQVTITKWENERSQGQHHKFKHLRPIIALANKPPPGLRVKAQKTGPQPKTGSHVLYNAWESFSKPAATLAVQADKGLIEFDSDITIELAPSTSQTSVQKTEQLIGLMCRTTLGNRWKKWGSANKRQCGTPAGRTILDRMSTACDPQNCLR